MLKELAKFEGLSGFHINDGMSKVMVPWVNTGGNAVIGDGYGRRLGRATHIAMLSLGMR